MPVGSAKKRATALPPNYTPIGHVWEQIIAREESARKKQLGGTRRKKRSAGIRKKRFTRRR
jgi:hypothetical protein